MPGDSRYAEADFTLDYTFDLGERASLTLGGLTYRFNGRDMRLTDVHGELIDSIVA